MLNIFKNKSDINQKKLYVEILSDKSKEYFLDAIIEDVNNHHINGNSIEGIVSNLVRNFDSEKSHISIMLR